MRRARRLVHGILVTAVLGLTATGPFRLAHVKADLVIVEVFNMYCPHCQAEAPNVNKLHRLIEDSADLKARARLIGIGIGNTSLEVDQFRKHFEVPFPLIPDAEAVTGQAAREPFGTPTFIVLKMGRESKPKVVKVHRGRIKDIEDFFRSLGGL